MVVWAATGITSQFENVEKVKKDQFFFLLKEQKKKKKRISTFYIYTYFQYLWRVISFGFSIIVDKGLFQNKQVFVNSSMYLA